MHLLYLNVDFKDFYNSFFFKMVNKSELQPAKLAKHISVGDILQLPALGAGEEVTIVLVLEGVEDGTVAGLRLAFPFFHLVGL